MIIDFGADGKGEMVFFMIEKKNVIENKRIGLNLNYLTEISAITRIPVSENKEYGKQN